MLIHLRIACAVAGRQTSHTPVFSIFDVDVTHRSTSMVRVERLYPGFRKIGGNRADYLESAISFHGSSNYRVPIAGEHFNCRTGHVNVVVILVPLDRQVAAKQMNPYRAVRSTGERSGNAHRTRARATGERLRPIPVPTSAARVHRG